MASAAQYLLFCWLLAGGSSSIYAAAAAATRRPQARDSALDRCPGYQASNIQTTAAGGLTADLALAGPACNAYGDDLQRLTLQVTYETDSRLHVKIQDAENAVYQVPEAVFPRPGGSSASSSSSSSSNNNNNAAAAALAFGYTAAPAFSFNVTRRDTGEVLFDTSAASLVFETQYLRLRTRLPAAPNLYGLGEHADPFRLNTTAYTRTLWSQDNYALPAGENLYGNHPVYFDHRGSAGTHGVFLLNSNGMDVVVDVDEHEGQFLEYNVLGGVLDFYFVAGPGPRDVARQYADIVGLSAMQPYWGLGFHQCRYGYQDVYNVAEVVYNYSQAAIPLETMWTDIDYMDRRAVFSLDPERFPLGMMRQLVDHLHAHDQHYVVMVDPAVAYKDYPPFNRGVQDNIWLLRANGSVWQGVVWPGVTSFPDWFAANITAYWNNEFAVFFDAATGVDIDALWIDMNEPSNFACDFPCDDPYQQAAASGNPPDPPPVRSWPRPLPGWPCDFQPPGTACSDGDGAAAAESSQLHERLPAVDSTSARPASLPRDLSSGGGNSLVLPPRQESGTQLGLPGRNLLYPKYAIHNSAAYLPSWNAAQGGLSNHTVNTDVIHQNGLAMYDTHNLYGSMMSTASRAALLARRPGLRPLVITRSTFAGAGASVGHWLGDNVSSWEQYRKSIAGLMSFAALYQVPMAGSDVCGFIGNVTEALCARWAMLGAFSPFYRNHNNYGASAQEFYVWPDTVAAAAKKAIDMRYRLMDYIYTALYRQSVDGTPLVNPVFFLYPHDERTFALELQYFYGDALLVAPVTDEDATSVDVYLPDDVFYDWHTRQRVQGAAAPLTVSDQGLTDIPLYIRGGTVVPLRNESAMTTAELRTKSFELLVAPGRNGTAAGQLYLDDGVSLEQNATTLVQFSYADGKLVAQGTFGYGGGVVVSKFTVLGGTNTSESGGGSLRIKGTGEPAQRDAESGAVSFSVALPLTGRFELELEATA